MPIWRVPRQTRCFDGCLEFIPLTGQWVAGCCRAGLNRPCATRQRCFAVSRQDSHQHPAGISTITEALQPVLKGIGDIDRDSRRVAAALRAPRDMARLRDCVGYPAQPARSPAGLWNPRTCGNCGQVGTYPDLATAERRGD